MYNNQILLVDDDEACRDAFSICLSSWEYVVQEAEDGATALELAKRQPFALLISDFDMPKMNGVELFEQIRQVQPEIDGILISGELTDSRRSAALDAGMLAGFHKPLELSQLLALVEKTCCPAAYGSSMAEFSS